MSPPVIVKSAYGQCVKPFQLASWRYWTISFYSYSGETIFLKMTTMTDKGTDYCIVYIVLDIEVCGAGVRIVKCLEHILIGKKLP